MTLDSPLYQALKGQVYDIVQVAAGRTNAEAQSEGFRDVYDLIMSDSDHSRQPTFIAMICDRLSEKQRPILLDGMAKEYTGLNSWMEYVERES